MSRGRNPILFKIFESENMPRELWQQFTARAVAEGRSPIAILRQFIEEYLKRPRHDTTPPNRQP